MTDVGPVAGLAALSFFELTTRRPTEVGGHGATRVEVDRLIVDQERAPPVATCRESEARLERGELLLFQPRVPERVGEQPREHRTVGQSVCFVVLIDQHRSEAHERSIEPQQKDIHQACSRMAPAANFAAASREPGFARAASLSLGPIAASARRLLRP